jgi:hypothetical protein
VIVRIATEGQYEIAAGDLERLNDLDDEAAASCAAENEERFRDVFGRLLAFVRTTGQPVAEDYLGGSDIILPPPDISLEEAKTKFQGEGLIPN